MARQRQQREDAGASFGGAQDLDGVSEKQQQEIEEQSRPSAALIHETIRAEGEAELRREWWALALSGLAAGLSMGFSLVMQGAFHAALPEGPARALIAPLGYTLGFLIVILGRQQLFTENTLTPVLPLLHNRDAATLGRMLRLSGLVLVTNTVGTILFAEAIAHSTIFDSATSAAFREIAQASLKSGFGVTFVKAVFAGWLIAILVWLLPAAETARPVIIIIVTYAISLGRFSHVIAGSVDCAYLVASGAARWSDFFARFYVPTLLGNVLGGVALVAALNYGQVASELKD